MPTTLQLITPEQAAKMLGVRTRHLLRLPIRRFRLGWRTVRYHVDDLLEYLNGSRPDQRAG